MPYKALCLILNLDGDGAHINMGIWDLRFVIKVKVASHMHGYLVSCSHHVMAGCSKATLAKI
jgi:hypothetical protein